jgi:lipopolysaccharide transport system ATP-binding protein
MKNIAISLKGVSKKYSIGKEKDGSLRGTLGGIFSKKSASTEDFWALSDVSFDIQKGDVIGIIGKNGAGKSTLLKILSQITKPTAGVIEIEGRVASLLEVGTGFHPELTGRENVYLNGTILGMSRKEVAAKFDEIVAFSGVEKFIDTPVKRYSSGMYVRLAFAVAAHLEPEILIIDEVLAVGDAEFQKKCLGKMKDVAGEGRTVIFVSHNIAAVSTLCNKGVVLEKGKMTFNGSAQEAISHYMDNKTGGLNYEYFDDVEVAGKLKLNSIVVRNEGKKINDPLLDKDVINIETEVEFLTKNPERYHITYHLSNEMGETMFSFDSGVSLKPQQKLGKNTFICQVPARFFQSGKYFLSLLILEDGKVMVKFAKDITMFTVIDGGRELGVYLGREPGFIRPQFDWELKHTAQ